MSILKDIITKGVGYFVVSSNMAKSVAIAALSTTGTFLNLLNERVASDIKDIKDNLKKQIEADTQKKVSEAVDAANKANLPKRDDAFAKAELRKKEADAAKTEAEAKAIELKAKGEFEKNMADAKARLLEAQSKIAQEGGMVFYNKADLQNLQANCQEKLEQSGEVQNNIESETVNIPENYLSEAEAGLDKDNKPLEYIDNKYELQDNVVHDKATGLTWQQSGSDHSMAFGGVNKYIADLNQVKYAGYSDWRLPTLAEAKSLLDPNKNKTNNLFINHIFDSKQVWIWTSDSYSASREWVVYFYNGYCNCNGIGGTGLVRAVR